LNDVYYGPILLDSSRKLHTSHVRRVSYSSAYICGDIGTLPGFESLPLTPALQNFRELTAFRYRNLFANIDRRDIVNG